MPWEISDGTYFLFGMVFVLLWLAGAIWWTEAEEKAEEMFIQRQRQQSEDAEDEPACTCNGTCPIHGGSK